VRHLGAHAEHRGAALARHLPRQGGRVGSVRAKKRGVTDPPLTCSSDRAGRARHVTTSHVPAARALFIARPRDAGQKRAGGDHAGVRVGPRRRAPRHALMACPITSHVPCDVTRAFFAPPSMPLDASLYEEKLLLRGCSCGAGWRGAGEENPRWPRNDSASARRATRRAFVPEGVGVWRWIVLGGGPISPPPPHGPCPLRARPASSSRTCLGERGARVPDDQGVCQIARQSGYAHRCVRPKAWIMQMPSK
jgi:hypothetical protein